MYPASVQEAIDNKLLVPSSTRTEQILQCVVCNLDLNGPVPAEMHLRGKNHKKASLRYPALIGQDLHTTSEKNPNDEESGAQIRRLMEQGVVEEITMAGAQHYSCTVCRCSSMNGITSLLSHLEGKQHKKMCNFGRMSILSSTSPDTSRPSLSRSSSPNFSSDNLSNSSLNLSSSSRSNGLSSTSAELTVALESGELRACSQPGFFECLVCHTTVTGEVSAMQHIQGKQHRKNSFSRSMSSSSACGGSYQVVDVGSSDAAANTGVALGDDSGQAVEAALQSGVLRRVNFQGSSDHFECLVCCTGGTMNGHRTAQSHLEGKSHLSMSRRVQTSGSVLATATAADGAAAPSPLASTAGGRTDERGDVQAALEQGVLVRKLQAGVELYECLLCRVAMTGPISARAHLTGGSHYIVTTRRSADLVNSGPRSSSPRLSSVSPTRPASHVSRSPQPSPTRPTSSPRCPSPEPAVQPVSDVCLAENLSLEEVLVEEQQNGTSIYYCVACGVAVTGQEEIKLHLATREHCHATSQLYTTPPCSSPSPSPTRQPGSQVSSPPRVTSSSAQHCLSPGTLDTSAQHRSSTAPTTALMNQLLAMAATDPSQLNLAGLVSDGTVRVETVAGLSQYRCVLCDVLSNGLCPLRQHLIGETHKKQTRRNRVSAANGLGPQQQSGVLAALPSSSASSCRATLDTEQCSDDEPILVIRVNEPIPAVWP